MNLNKQKLKRLEEMTVDEAKNEEEKALEKMCCHLHYQQEAVQDKQESKDTLIICLSF